MDESRLAIENELTRVCGILHSLLASSTVDLKVPRYSYPAAEASFLIYFDPCIESDNSACSTNGRRETLERPYCNCWGIWQRCRPNLNFSFALVPPLNCPIASPHVNDVANLRCRLQLVQESGTGLFYSAIEYVAIKIPATLENMPYQKRSAVCVRIFVGFWVVDLSVRLLAAASKKEGGV